MLLLYMCIIVYVYVYIYITDHTLSLNGNRGTHYGMHGVIVIIATPQFRLDSDRIRLTRDNTQREREIERERERERA